MFELKQLRCFVAVASEMNFHRAAERLNMTQSPLSRQIQLLENAIGVELFDRTGRQIRLTPAGARFLVEAQDLLHRAEDSALAARAVASGLEGAVILGFIPISTLGILPRIMPALTRDYPGIRVVLREMLTVHQVQALESGRHDLGIMRVPKNHANLELCRIRQEPYLLAMHRSHPLCQREDLALADLEGQDFLMYSPSDGWYGYDKLIGIFSAAGIYPRFVQYFGETLTMLSLVNVGAGLALVADSARVLGFENVVFRSIALPEAAQSEYFLACKSQRLEDPAVRTIHARIADLAYA